MQSAEAVILHDMSDHVLETALVIEVDADDPSIMSAYHNDGDVKKLSGLYSEGIEIKVFKGNSSLRRKLTRCNREEIVFRPHPLTDEGIRALRPEIADYWHDFIAWACQRVKFSTHSEIALDFNESKMLFSDPSSVIDLWEQTGKPYKVIEI